MSFEDKTKDDFWDIADLVPKKRVRPLCTPGFSSTEPVEIKAGAERPQEGNGRWEDLPLTVRYVNPPEQKKQEADETYEPANSLISRVSIYRQKKDYPYYEQFARQAAELDGAVGEECAAVPFFSYMPQYTQLNAEQLGYYLWWRTNFRRGTVLPADFSYLLLYLYEQINLSLVKDPRVGQENIVRLWLCYGKENPRIGMLVREWLCDYSLLHRLPPPRFSPAQYRALLGGFRLKEFYIPADPDGNLLSSAILLFCNNYDYTKSKYYTEETRADFERVLGGAVRVALEFLREQGSGLLAGKAGISTMTRDCFAGAICSYRLKCRIEVSFTSFSGTHELRFIITDVLKYAENALRAALGIRSRLSIYAVSASMRARLDEYLRGVLPEKRKRASGEKAAKAVEVPAYERRYDLPVTPISPVRAAEIEARSWATTKRLVEAFCPENGVEKAETDPTMCTGDAAWRNAGERMPEKAKMPHDGARKAEIESQMHLPLDREAEKTGPTPAFVETPANGGEKAAFLSEKETFASQGADGAQGLMAALGDLVPFLKAVAASDRAAQRDIARSRGEMLDSVVDKINAVAGDMIGDILLEDLGGVYGIVEEYLDLLKEEGVL